MSKVFSLILLLHFIQAAFSQKDCSTADLDRTLGSFDLDLTLPSVAHGTKSILTCHSNSKPGSLLTVELVPDPTIECIDGQWFPEHSFYCFKGCQANLLERDVGEFSSEAEPEDGFYDHGAELFLTCPDTHFLADEYMQLLQGAKTNPASYCLSGNWFPLYQCWDKASFGEPKRVTLEPELKEAYKIIKEERRKEEEEKLLDITTPLSVTDDDTFQPEQTTPFVNKGGPCFTIEIERAIGTWDGIDTSLESVPHGSKGTLVCDQNTKPGSSESFVLVPDPSIECIDGLWSPFFAFQCFKSCSDAGLFRDVGTFTFTKEKVGGFYEHGAKALIECPETHFEAEADMTVFENWRHRENPPQYCVDGQWFPEFFCFDKSVHQPVEVTASPEFIAAWKRQKELARRQHELNRQLAAATTVGLEDEAATEKPAEGPEVEGTTEKPVKPTAASAIDEVVATSKPQLPPTDGSISKFVGSNEGVSCDLHSDCHTVNYAPKELICDWDSAKHAWAAGVKLPRIPVGCFCDQADGVFTVEGSGKCVISRIDDSDILKWAYCSGNIYEKCT